MFEKYFLKVLLTFAGGSKPKAKVSLFCISFQVILLAWFLTEYRTYCVVLNCWQLIVLCEECLVVWLCTSLVLVKKFWKILIEVNFYYFQKQLYAEMLFKTGVLLEILQYSQENICWSLFISTSCQKRLHQRRFLWKMRNFYNKAFFVEHMVAVAFVRLISNCGHLPISS